MTDSHALIIEPLGRRHDRNAFSCGLHELDRYPARQAGQDVRRRIARVFVCTAVEADAVLGFCTLGALSIDPASLPEALSRRLPRHPVPCALIGRLAVDRSAHGRGVGRMLPADAVKLVLAAGETVAMHAVIVDAANDDAKRFYERFGFLPLTDDPMCLFLPLGHASLRNPSRARDMDDRPEVRTASISSSAAFTSSTVRSHATVSVYGGAPRGRDRYSPYISVMRRRRCVASVVVRRATRRFRRRLLIARI